LFIDLLSSRVNDLLKLSERYRIGRLFWPIVSTIGLSGFHIIVLTLLNILWKSWSRIHINIYEWRIITPDFIPPEEYIYTSVIPPNLWPPNSPDLNPVDYYLRHTARTEFTRQAVRMSTSYAAGFLWNGTSLTSA